MNEQKQYKILHCYYNHRYSCEGFLLPYMLQAVVYDVSMSLQQPTPQLHELSLSLW